MGARNECPSGVAGLNQGAEGNVRRQFDRFIVDRQFSVESIKERLVVRQFCGEELFARAGWAAPGAKDHETGGVTVSSDDPCFREVQCDTCFGEFCGDEIDCVADLLFIFARDENVVGKGNDPEAWELHSRFFQRAKRADSGQGDRLDERRVCFGCSS